MLNTRGGIMYDMHMTWHFCVLNWVLGASHTPPLYLFHYAVFRPPSYMQMADCKNCVAPKDPAEEADAEAEAARAEAQRKADEVAQAQARKKTAEEGAQGEEEAVKVLWEAYEKEDIDVILAVMAQHRDSTKVQEEGCHALGNVAHVNAATRLTIVEKGGIEAVFHAMTQHSHDEYVQRWGCYMMYRMVRLESARPAIRKGKAVMDAARNNFPNNEYIQAYLNNVYAMI